MNANDQMLVSRRWLERADAAINRMEPNEPTPAQNGAGLFYDIRLAQLRSAWVLNSSGLWTATACFVVGGNIDETTGDDLGGIGKVDLDFVFDVCAPLANSKPTGQPKNQRFYVVWRGRWESIQTLPFIPRYLSGESIMVWQNTSGNCVIDNKGLLNAQIPGDSYIDRETLYFNAGSFTWKQSTLPIASKREITIKTKNITVVTNVGENEDGTLNVTKEIIKVIG